jgi:hypothetical protein
MHLSDVLMQPTWRVQLRSSCCWLVSAGNAPQGGQARPAALAAPLHPWVSEVHTSVASLLWLPLVLLLLQVLLLLLV